MVYISKNYIINTYYIMSLTTISAVNNYLLSKKTITNNNNDVIESNMTFPNSYTNLATQIGNLSYSDTHSPTFTYSGGSGIKTYANGNYKIITSSYDSFEVGIINVGKMYFDDNFTTYGGQKWNSSYTIYSQGVQKPANTQDCYTTSGVYVGGGTGYYFTTNYNGGSVNGEYIQIELPYKICLKTLYVSKRDNQSNRTPKYITVVGSDNGTTWTLIHHSLSFPQSTSNNTWYSDNISNPTKRFSKLRFIINQNWHVHINMSMKFSGDIYDLLADTE